MPVAQVLVINSSAHRRMSASGEYTIKDYKALRTSKPNQQIVFVVAEPPTSASGREHWVHVNTFTREINRNIEQPDPSKVVLCAQPGNSILESDYGIRYTYGDDSLFSLMWCCGILGTVIFSVLTTPLVLLCCIPMLLKWKKVK